MRAVPRLALLCALALLCLSAALPTAVTAAEEEASSDVTVLTDANFDEITSSGSWLLEFYAPWCGHCKTLAPQFESAATRLRGVLRLGKIDATQQSGLANRFNIRGFPQLKFLREGETRNYNGPRSTEGMVAFGKDMTATPVHTLATMEEWEALEMKHPVSAVFFGGKAGPEKGSLKFYRVDGTSTAIHTAAGVSEDDMPVIVLVTAHSSPREAVSRYSGPWVESSLRDWLVAHKLPLISELDASNFEDVTNAGKRIVLAVHDPRGVGVGLNAGGAARGKAFLEQLYPLAQQPALQEQFVFASIDGVKFHKYVAQFGVPVTDASTVGTVKLADTSALPTLVVLEQELDYYFAPPAREDGRSHPIRAEDVGAFLRAVAAGSVSSTGVIPWYHPARYLKLVEKKMDKLPGWQVALIASAFMIIVLGTVGWCCVYGLDSAMGAQLSPEEEAELHRQHQAALALASKRDAASGEKTKAKAKATPAAAVTTAEDATVDDVDAAQGSQEGVRSRKQKK